MTISWRGYASADFAKVQIERKTTSCETCETCGTPTAHYDKRCNNCWEVEHRLPDYLRSPKAWEFVRRHLPKLDDWKDGHLDAWDYNAVLRDNCVTVEWCDTLVDGERTEHRAGEFGGWSFHWRHGYIHIGQTTEIIARKAAALFVSLWLRGVSASFCDNLMDGYIVFLERQKNTTLTFLAEISHYARNRQPFLRLTREGFCTREIFGLIERKIIKALDPQPDEEIVVTFTKRKIGQ